MINPVQSTLARRFTIGGFIAAALTLAACSTERALGPNTESAEAATGRPSNAVLSLGAIPKKALLRSKSLKTAITASATFTATGGTLSIPAVGFTLTVPANAIGTKPITIKVTALAGYAVAYSFEPHGTTFLRGLSMKQDLASTTWAHNSSWMLLGGGYFKNDSQVNTTTGAALLDETVPVTVFGSLAFLNLWHFSGYMVSMD